MKEEKTAVSCCQCGKHFKKEELQALQINGVLALLHICTPCLEKSPEISSNPHITVYPSSSIAESGLD